MMDSQTSDQVMNWIATGNQIAMDWFTLTHTPEGQTPVIPRYIPPAVTQGFATGAAVAATPTLLIGVLILGIILMMND